MNCTGSTVQRGNDHRHCCRRTFIPSIIMAFASFLFVSCTNTPPGGDTFSNDSALVHIGDQIWMARNFDGVIFMNGDSIPHAESVEEWVDAGESGKPAWCYYENDTRIGKEYGRIYNWYAVNDPRGFSPKGWHVPTNDEWIILEDFLESSATELKCKDGGSKNESGFCAVLGGYRGKEGGYSGIGEFTYLTSSTERDQNDNDIWGRGIHHNDSTMMRCGLYKGHGLYVRLIKD